MVARKLMMGCLCLVVAAGGFQACRAGEAAMAPPVPEVTCFTVGTEAVALNTECPGRTRAWQVAEIRPQVNGLIQKRLFEEGGDVRAGETMYLIDPAPYRVALQQAEAALALAQARVPAVRSRVERLQGLLKVDAVGHQELEDAQSALLQAQAQVQVAQSARDNARIQLDYTPLKSPISGRVGRSAVTVGAMVTAYQPQALAVVQQLDPMFVDVTQASAEILAMSRRLGQRHKTESRTVRLLLEDGTPYPLEGELKFRDVTVDPGTGAVTLRLVFPNPDHILLPGMYVRAIVAEGVQEQGMMVPQEGVTRNLRGKPVAWVLSETGTVEERMLTLDRAIGNRWLVLEGLQPGDHLIVEGLQRVRPGMKARMAAPAHDKQIPPDGTEHRQEN